MTVLYVVTGFASPTTMLDWVFLVGQVFLSSAYLSTIIAQLPELAETAGAASIHTGVKVEMNLSSQIRSTWVLKSGSSFSHSGSSSRSSSSTTDSTRWISNARTDQKERSNRVDHFEAVL